MVVGGARKLLNNEREHFHQSRESYRAVAPGKLSSDSTAP